MKFVRKPSRIYTVMDFEDGEEIEFAYHSSVPSSKAKGYAFYRSKKDGRTIGRQRISSKRKRFLQLWHTKRKGC